MSRLPAVLVLFLALVLAVTACTSSNRAEPTSTQDQDQTQDQAQTVPPDPGPTPRVGECHALTFRQALAITARIQALNCRRPHTAQTYFVGRLDLQTNAGFIRRVDSEAAQRQMRRACTARLPRHLARTPRDLRLTMVKAVWFSPSPESAEAGADWFRCDVVALAAPNTLLRLPRRTARWAQPPAMCATAAPGTKAFRRVTCAAKHTWRAVASVDIPGDRLPPRAAITDRMDPICREAARETAADPLNLRWSQESPNRAQWDAGQRYGICWIPA